MTETLAHGYSSESTQRELSNEYQYDRVYMVFQDLCVLVLWTRVAIALEGLIELNVTGTSNEKKQISLVIAVKIGNIVS